MIDTHTHLYLPDYGEEIKGIIDKSISLGVRHFILPNIDMESIDQMKRLHGLFPEVTSMAVGLHPTEVKENYAEVLESIKKELNTGNYVAVGEIGMDLYWDQTYIKEEKEAFEYQVKLAEEYKLPVIIHCRSALKETLEILEKVKPRVPLIFHSFTGNTEDIRRIRKNLDPYFGINGVVTYKNASDLRDSLKEIGLEKIVLETDSPFLSPVPYRGKRNNSSNLLFIRNKIAEVLERSPEEVESVTDRNSGTIFGI